MYPFNEDHASKYGDPLLDGLFALPPLSSCVVRIPFLPLFFPPLAENCTLRVFFPLPSRSLSLLKRYRAPYLRPQLPLAVLYKTHSENGRGRGLHKSLQSATV